MTFTIETDVAVIGSGMGGGVIARALAEQGIRTCVLERGTRLPRAAEENWSPRKVFVDDVYKNAAPWLDTTGNPFKPGVHYWVGGNTKMYGASLARFREQDFGEIQFREGLSPAWPFSYADLEPFYGIAEQWFGVHGTPGQDASDPWRSTDYPYPALPHEPYMTALQDRLRAAGYSPAAASIAVDRRDGGACIRCRTCDGFPCAVDAKGDAETRAIDPALQSGHASLETSVRILRLHTNPAGTRVVEATGVRNGEQVRVRARTFVVSAGAVNSARLLLMSANDKHPDGLGNSSGLLGRRYMVHNATFMVALDPRRPNHTDFQKTISINDWYLTSDLGEPLGNIQMLGKLQGAMIKSARPYLPLPLLNGATKYSADFYLESEDLPDPANRITLNGDNVPVVHWRPNNMSAHRGLIRKARTMLKKVGYPVVLHETMGIATNSHMCGTAVAGTDPAASVLDSHCRSHDVENLFVVDSSFFPSSAAMNPALTIAAQAIRVAREGDLLR
ncbi:GMC family oxidoreductase [Actinoplanes sp. NBRC 101535]|uniref:GMC oxidoreductase n=1 Tax=Actinoplanes sp. NBRC 101535 TaxID=3032196 RepID=UPI00249F9A0C|nr:GMC family oxidoreductase [Actinoplanes sp. NBRC 101535]GLY02388.1 dehydrogenase [Actinoplanes sp. NBRC 101535]